MCPIGKTVPKYPAAAPWLSGFCANESEDAIAGLNIPDPMP